MGQKVNPIAFRLGFNRGWQSRWLALTKKEYRENLILDLTIRELIERDYRHALIAAVEIARVGDLVSVTVQTARPGVLIGRGGSGTREISEKILKAVNSRLSDRKLSEGNLQLTVREYQKPDLSAKLIAEQIGDKLTRRLSFRSAGRRAVSRAMERGAKGVKIRLAGRLGGSRIAQSDTYVKGQVPLSTLRSNIDYASVHSKTVWGVIGVKVWVYLGDKEFGSHSDEIQPIGR